MNQQAAAAAGRKTIFGLLPGNLKYRSQIVAYPYFLVSAVLFVLQVVFGLIMGAQYVWPEFLADSMPFNVARASHLNLMIFWLLLGLIGASYYLIPEETESEIFSTKLAYFQFGAMLFTGLGTMFSFMFLRDVLDSIGKPFTEAPMPWPWFIAAAMVIFLINVGLTIIRSKRWTAISVILFMGMAGLSFLYLIDLIFFPNLAVDFFWWWWIIHLWVEGSWELIVAAITAFLMIKVTGVEKSKMYRLLYVEVGLVFFTGIIGIGHHYYWIGTPEYWLFWGALFSALEPIPIALMAYDALKSMRKRGAEPVNRIAWYWLGGSAIAHFFGAGVWGFAQTLPQINQWTHGTLVTASHGHFSFFGAFAMIVLAAIYYMVPKMKGLAHIREGRGMWGYWLMSMGMLTMVLCFTIAGVVQVYLWRLLGMDFMTVRDQYVSFWMFWVFIAGLMLFLPGVLLYLWDFFGLKAAQPQNSKETAQAGHAES